MIRIQKLSTSGLLTVAFLTICLFAGCTEEMSVDELQQEKQQLSQRIERAIGVIDDRIHEKSETGAEDEPSAAHNKLEDLKNRLTDMRSEIAGVEKEEWPQYHSQALDRLISIKTTLDTMRVPEVEISEKL
jgi:hypothetical protein